MYPSPRDKDRSLTVAQRKTEARKASRDFMYGCLVAAVLFALLGWHDFEKAKSIGENLAQLAQFLQGVFCGGVIGTMARPVWQAINRSGWLNSGAGGTDKEIEFCQEQLKGIEADLSRGAFTEEARVNYLKTQEHYAERLRIAIAKEKLRLESTKNASEKKIQKQSADEP